MTHSPGDVLEITFKQLQAFVRVVELGSFGAAAESLGVSQPSISRHVKLLEARCGTLMKRSSGSRLVLTPVGSIVFARSTELLQSVLAMRTELNDSDDATRTVRIAAFDHLRLRIQQFSSDFLIENPASRLEMRIVASEDEGIGLLRRGEIDLFYINKVGAGDSSSEFLLGPIAVGLYATPALIARAGLNDRTAPLPIIMPNTQGLRLVEETLAVLGLTKIDVVARVPNIDTALSLCRRGVGVALLYDDLLQADLASGALVRLAWSGERLMRYCYVGAESAGRPEVRHFQEFANRKMASDYSFPVMEA